MMLDDTRCGLDASRLHRTTLMDNYKLVWHQGHIYWAIHYHYYPRVQLHKFESIDKEPISLDSFVKWTNASHCRAIVNLSSKEII